jgi:alkylhydroperoxidase family enzyme
MYDMLFGDRDPVAEPGTDTGTPGNWWTVFALVPDCLKHAIAGFQFYRHASRKLNPQLRELGQTRAGYTCGSQFVYSQHCKSCRSVGMSEEKIQAIAHWMHAVMSRALHLEYDDVDERIVEIAAPQSGSDDVMNMVDTTGER